MLAALPLTCEPYGRLLPEHGGPTLFVCLNSTHSDVGPLVRASARRRSRAAASDRRRKGIPIHGTLHPGQGPEPRRFPRRWSILFEVLTIERRLQTMPELPDSDDKIAVLTPRRTAWEDEESDVRPVDDEVANDPDQPQVIARQYIGRAQSPAHDPGRLRWNIWSSIDHDLGDLEGWLGSLAAVPAGDNEAARVFRVYRDAAGTTQSLVLAETRRLPEAELESGHRHGCVIHALQFSGTSMHSRLLDDPFGVFDSGVLHGGLGQQLPAPGHGRISRIPDACVSLPSMRAEPAPAQELLEQLEAPTRRLLLRAASHAEARPRQYTLVLVGSPAQAETLLRCLFGLLPPQLRRECSFHTLFDDDPEKNGGSRPYWCISVPELHRRQPGDIVFDLGRRRFVAGTDVYSTTTPFERWLERKINNTVPDVCQLAEEIAAVHALTRCCSGGEAALPAISDQLYADFLRASEGWLRELLRERPGPATTEPLLPFVHQALQTGGPQELRFLRGGLVDLNWIIERAIEWIGGSPRQLPDEQQVGEIRLLAESARGGMPSASLLLAMLARCHGDWRDFAARVSRLTPEAYERLAEWCLSSLCDPSGRLPFQVQWYSDAPQDVDLRFGVRLVPRTSENPAFVEACHVGAGLLGGVVQEPSSLAGRVRNMVKPAPPRLEQVGSITPVRLWPRLMRVLERRSPFSSQRPGAANE